MISEDRIKQLMEQVGMPNSMSLCQAFRQCAMEATMVERDRCCEVITQQNALLASLIRQWG